LVLPIIVFLAWAAVGAVAGVASGYVIDQVVGDGKYTRTELIVDATTGAMGLSVLKAGAKVLGGLRYTAGAIKLEKAEDAAVVIRTGFAAARQGIAEIYAIKGVELAITGAGSQQSEQGPGAPPAAPTPPAKPGRTLKTRGRPSNSRKSWCRRHRQYDLCR
jgi:hypothetical protein